MRAILAMPAALTTASLAVNRYVCCPQSPAPYGWLEKKYGQRMKEMPLGAIAVYTLCDKLRTGLTQIMAGAPSFRLDTVKRTDLMALTEECAKISGIKYVMDSYREEAMAILEGRNKTRP